MRIQKTMESDKSPVAVGECLVLNTTINTDSECPIQSDKVTVNRSRRRILWNLFILNFSYCLFYTGFWALTNLQSTMNAESGMGPDSQAVIYFFSMLSSLFVPELSISKFGCKRVIFFSTLLGLPYIAANVYLRWDTLMTSSVLFGLGSGPFQAALTVYVDEMALRFQGTISENIEFVMACFFGVNAFFMENTQVWGNAISFLVLKPHHKLSESQNVSNYSNCGIHFGVSGDVSNSNLFPPSEEDRFILISIFVTMGIVALFLYAFFVDPLFNDIKIEYGCKEAKSSFVASLKHLVNVDQLLLIPITIVMGLESALYSNEFTEAYIACSWGVHHVGFVTICFGVCGALMSLLVGPLVKWISQMAVLILAACANVGTCILLFLWEPSPDSTFTYFLIAGIWGMGDAIWWSQVTALYGLMFPNDREAAFSNLYFWSFLGFFLSYSYANYLTVAVKINILLCFLITGMIGYLVGQAKIKCTAKREYVPISQGE